MDKIYTIYKVTNKINGKIYIGFDSNWPKRKACHLSSKKFPKQYFHRALAKHGEENFLWEPIYQSKDHDHTLKVMEPYFIKEYNSITEGYNLTRGGEGFSGIFTEEHKKKLSESRKNFRHSVETKRKISESKKGQIPPEKTLFKKGHCPWNKNKTGCQIGGFLGKKHSVETKRKISEAGMYREVSIETRKKLSEKTKIQWQIKKMVIQ